MYLNINYIHSKDLTVIDVMILQIVKQNKNENLQDTIAMYLNDEQLSKFEDRGLITQVKRKKKSDSEFSRLRTTKKANDLLDNAETPEITEDILKIYEWVANFYKVEGKEVGNQKKCKMYIAKFSKESGITRNSLAYLIATFLKDEKEMEYSHKMEYLFFKGSSVFSTKFDLHQSRLYQYYQKNKEVFDKKFEQT